MLRRFIIIFSIVCLSHRLQCQVPQAWPLPVTSFGEPIVNVTLYEFNQPEFVSKITLLHKLSFDGLSYKSYMFMPAFESYLVKSHKSGAYLWTDEQGSMVELSPGTENRPLEMTALSTDAWKITVKPTKTTYTYVKGKLIALTKNDKEYAFKYEKNRLISVSRTKPTSELLAELLYEENNLKTIVFRNKSMQCKSDREQGIISCKDSKTGMPLFTSEFKNGLIRSWWTGERDESYDWGEVIWTHYSKPFFIKIPIIIEDNHHIYKWQANPRFLEGYCEYAFINKSLAWRYFFLNHKLKLTHTSDKN